LDFKPIPKKELSPKKFGGTLKYEKLLDQRRSVEKNVQRLSVKINRLEEKNERDIRMIVDERLATEKLI